MRDTDERGVINIIITGVGGQGNVVASQILASAALEAGFQVNIGETFGASQRGGSVMSHVRIFRTGFYGPLIPEGECDLILGFEPLETFKILQKYGNEDSIIIMNDRPTYPVCVLSGRETYPALEDLKNAVKMLARNTCITQATQLAIEIGNVMATNIVMTGMAAGSGVLPIARKHFEKCIGNLFSGELYDLNIEAFGKGYSVFERQYEEFDRFSL